VDLVVHLEPAAAGTGHAEMTRELRKMLTRLTERTERAGGDPR
jgi:hypothetical protein